jgi:hypothetical protein
VGSAWFEILNLTPELYLCCKNAELLPDMSVTDVLPYIKMRRYNSALVNTFKTRDKTELHASTKEAQTVSGEQFYSIRNLKSPKRLR